MSILQLRFFALQLTRRNRFKLKFSPDKVDTMVVQAVALLDDLDKEINIYAMRVKVSLDFYGVFEAFANDCLKEWYGWHFPELGKIIIDNLAYAKVIKAMGMMFTTSEDAALTTRLSTGFRTNASTTDFSALLPEDLEATVKAAAEISMGTEISDSDIAHIHSLCDQVIAISAYRAQLAEYLRNRMNAIAPNLTALVGELVGARLISHAGSLLSLAKHPASTVQILGAEKALFRALKTKHDTPKYGLIYHVRTYRLAIDTMLMLCPGVTHWSGATKTKGQGKLKPSRLGRVDHSDYLTRWREWSPPRLRFRYVSTLLQMQTGSQSPWHRQ